MNEAECLSRMVAPGDRRKGKYREGVIQIMVTRACDKACFNCTQLSNLAGPYDYMTLEHFEQACLSLKGYFGVVGVFGGNPAMHPGFTQLCEILRKHFPKEQRGLWCNNLLRKENGEAARDTFDPAVSNLNVHLDAKAFAQFREWWPESRPFGLDKDSRHAPCYVAMKDAEVPMDSIATSRGLKLGSSTVRRMLIESEIWTLTSGCDINQHWSAMIGTFRGQLRAWFCEIAGAQAMAHQHKPDYPDTGLPIAKHDSSKPLVEQGPNGKVTKQWNYWWQLPMGFFTHQVRKHCHECGVPLRGHGELAQADDTNTEQVSATHEAVYKLKRQRRPLQLVTDVAQLGKPLGMVTKYLQNADG